jgi:hypothetical protein
MRITVSTLSTWRDRSGENRYVHRIFLLSPAHSGGERARMILSDRATFDLAVKLRQEGASLAEVFSLLSALYFRGKVAYSQRFAAAPDGVAGAFVITPNRGLVPADTIVTIADLKEMAAVPVHAAESRYRLPLESEARRIEIAAGANCSFVLLGSIATAKYVEPLLQVFGARLVFPVDFVGRGDMSRGGLLLRSARAGVELQYAPVMNAVRHGSRPPKLPKLGREDNAEGEE